LRGRPEDKLGQVGGGEKVGKKGVEVFRHAGRFDLKGRAMDRTNGGNRIREGR